MKFISMLFLWCISSSQMWSQENSMLINSKSYPSTPIWNFMCDNYVLTGIASIQIAKTEKGGYLRVGIETNNPSFTISGNLYVDLKDFSAIICTDKGIRSIEGNQIVSYYAFTPAEMKRLQKNNIEAIRFLINGKKTLFSGQTGHFTAVNKKKYFHTTYDFTTKEYETALSIRSLFIN
jgi:hypothetical protein